MTRTTNGFGFIFIVCATGKSAEEMLALLRERLPHDRATELRVAAEEQAKITALRLSRRISATTFAPMQLCYCPSLKTSSSPAKPGPLTATAMYCVPLSE